MSFVNTKYSCDVLKNKKKLLPVGFTGIGFDRNTNLLLTQNLSEYNDKLHFIAESSGGKG